jgi:hypothetical protein
VQSGVNTPNSPHALELNHPAKFAGHEQETYSILPDLSEKLHHQAKVEMKVLSPQSIHHCRSSLSHYVSFTAIPSLLKCRLGRVPLSLAEHQTCAGELYLRNMTTVIRPRRTPSSYKLKIIKALKLQTSCETSTQ